MHQEEAKPRIKCGATKARTTGLDSREICFQAPDMVYKVILDCTPRESNPYGPFYSVKFVEADTPDSAILIAVAQTKVQMKQQGFTDDHIASYRCLSDEVTPSDEVQLSPLLEIGLIFYPAEDA